MAKRMTGRKAAAGLAVVAACALSVQVIPAAAQTLSGQLGESVSLAARGSFASFTPASVDSRLAQFVAERWDGKGKLMRFTPAGAPNRPDRAVNVAVRVDPDVARAMAVRSGLAAAAQQVAAAPTAATPELAIAPTRFNLGVSRGYGNFAPATAALPEGVRRAEMPDLSQFEPSPGVKRDPSRFGARIRLEEEQRTGRLPRTRDAMGDQRLDVTGSYSVTRNLDVTAGVRYEQDRDRLDPVTDQGEDSQSVYVGTQFRF